MSQLSPAPSPDVTRPEAGAAGTFEDLRGELPESEEARSDAVLYTVGGTVQAGGGVYLARRADAEMLALCRAGTFAFVLTARQMGKSSLMVRTAEQLYEEGIRSVIIDLTRIGKQVTADQWYVGLLVVIQEQLELGTDAAEWWGCNGNQGPVQRMTRFLEEEVLGQLQEHIVIFVDEIDTTLGMGFTDDFYAAIRYLYNARASNPELARLSFVLVGVATPGDLIQDEKRTPFNLGQRVELTDFTLEEASPLAQGLGSSAAQGRQVLEWVLGWTGGHPYLTQRLCQALVDHQQHAGGGAWTRQVIQEVVERTFFAEKSFQDNNLVFVRDMLTRRAPDPERVLRTYQDIRRGWRVRDEERSLMKAHLKLSGVVRRQGELLRVRNPIYERVFTVAWARSQLPVDWRVVRLAALALLVTGFVVLLPASVMLYTRLAEARSAREAAQQDKLKAEDDKRKAEQAKRQAEDNKRQAEEERAQARQEAHKLQADALRAKDEADTFRQEALRLQAEARLALEEKALAEQESSRVRDQLEAGRRALEAGRREAFSYALMNQADATLRRASSALTVSTALSIEALRLYPSADAMDSLIRALLQLRSPQARLEHGDNVLATAFSPNGSLLITASEDRTARLWEVATGRQRALLPHGGAVAAVAFSPDGRTLATASDDRTARLWSADTGMPLGRPLPHEAFVNAVAFSPDGRLLLTGSEDGTARLWNVATGEPLASPPMQHRLPLNAVAFSPDGRLVATASQDKTARLWNPATGKLLIRPLLHKARVLAVAFSPDGRLVATASEDRTARLWDVTTGQSSATLRHDKAVTAVAFSPEGARVATASSDKTARLWDAATGQQLALLPHESPVNSVALSPDGKALVTASDGRHALLWSTDPRPPLALLPHGSTPLSMAFSADGKALATATEDSTVHLWSVATGEPLAPPLRQDARVLAVASTPEGTRVAAPTEDHTVRVWDPATRTALARLPHTSKVSAVAFSLEGTRLATATEDGTVRLWSITSGEPLTPPLRHEARVLAVAFSPEGSRLATASEDNTARLWSAATGQPLGGPLKHQLAVTALAFSPDGQTLATASDDSTARLWDVATGRQRLLLQHDTTVTSVAFSPDGTRVATASEDDSARMWDAVTGQRLARLPHGGRVLAVAFSPEGTHLATASEGGTTHLWPVRPEDWSHLACSLLPRNLRPKEWPADVGQLIPYRETCPNLP